VSKCDSTSSRLPRSPASICDLHTCATPLVMFFSLKEVYFLLQGFGMDIAPVN
jgi:hypothetical protein